MMPEVAKLGSLKLTAILMLPLILTVFAVGRSDSVDSNWVAIPLALLGINLAAAIATNAAFRLQPALLAFHVCLLAMIVLAGIGALYQYDGHIELVEGEAFDASRVELTDFGLLRQHGNESPRFTQGRITVDYVPGLIRQSTFSDVLVDGVSGQSSTKQLGDQANMTIDGYRFSTSFNKGFATVLQWLGNDGDVLLGAINFPSYPEHEWKQINDWTTPGGEHIGLELELAAMADQAHAWRLQSEGLDFTIKITLPDGTSTRLSRGGSLLLHGGRLTVAELRMWMGYRVDSNPMLQWVFVVALLSIAALSMHFYERFWNVGRHHLTEAGGRRHARVC